MRSELAVPVWRGGDPWGALAIGEPRAGVFDGDDVRLVSAAAEQLASALRSADQYGRLESAYIGTAEALAAALEARDTGSTQRAHEVARDAERIGRRLSLPEGELRDLRLGAILHDVGKIAVPEQILRKPGPLTVEERHTVEQHAEAGEDILRSVPFLAGALPLVRHGHERWDGQGYPDGLAGEDIPLGARIIAACDAWNAMQSNRPYHPAMSGDEARGELLSNAGTQFDPSVVNVLLEAVGGYGDGEVAAARSTSPAP
jgi:HD-GYP domain-containing protein (c-di-GMP phosphodiesterase class II)